MSFATFTKKMLTSKLTLNVVAGLSLFNVIGYMAMGQLNALLYFIVLAVLVRFFSKNMTLVLGVPLLLVNMLAMRGVLEGMETRAPSPESGSSKEIKKPVPAVADAKKKRKTANDAKTGQGLVMQPIEGTTAEEADNAAQTSGGEQEGKAGFEAGRRKSRRTAIDYASTIEDAYDELNAVLGSEGIQRLTTDTQHLMKQQMQLAEAMKNMGPMVESLAPMVKNLEGMMGDKNLGGMMDLAKKLTGGKA